MDKSTLIAVIASVILALSVFFIIYVPAVHHPIEVDGMISDNFPSTFEALAYVAGVFVGLPASVVALVVVLAIKAKRTLVSRKQK